MTDRAKRLVDGTPGHPSRTKAQLYHEVERALEKAYEEGVAEGKRTSKVRAAMGPKLILERLRNEIDAAHRNLQGVIDGTD